ncbi:WW domain binding protein 1-like [Liolophura sinensis]|uniref:WW domain binding protein 1-like n=1 Tax=Liolophura sinensis TaxID=3198878 RepID=UPI0031585D01
MASSNMSLVLFAALTLTLISTVQAGYRRCGIWDCYGAGVYCCGSNCCYYVYSYWWFWSIWALGIAIIITIVFACCRARRRRLASGVVVRTAQPVYGAATSYTYTGPAYPGASGTGYNQPYTIPPTTSPPTAPAYQEKPPAYNP